MKHHSHGTFLQVRTWARIVPACLLAVVFVCQRGQAQLLELPPVEDDQTNVLEESTALKNEGATSFNKAEGVLHKPSDTARPVRRGTSMAAKALPRAPAQGHSGSQNSHANESSHSAHGQEALEEELPPGAASEHGQKAHEAPKDEAPGHGDHETIAGEAATSEGHGEGARHEGNLHGKAREEDGASAGKEDGVHLKAKAIDGALGASEEHSVAIQQGSGLVWFGVVVSLLLMVIFVFT